MTPPGDKDILFGRGRNVFQHIGNKVFRKLIDLHICDYVYAKVRRNKTLLVREIVEMLTENGYRFMKADERGNFIHQMGEIQSANKIGHALRDRSPLLERIIREPYKTRAQLKKEGISVLKYAEHITLTAQGDDIEEVPPEDDEPEEDSSFTLVMGGDGQNHLVRTAAGAAVQQQRGGQVAGNRNPTQAEQQGGQKAKSNREFANANQAAAAAPKPMQQPAPRRLSDIAESPMGTSRPGSGNKATAAQPRRKSRNQAKPNIKRNINEIVVPAMKHGDLPYGGYWKFFPLPEVQEAKVDLGQSAKGWILKLEPISFNAEPITLDVV